MTHAERSRAVPELSRRGFGAHLRALEHESIYILREVAAQCERAAILFSGGKDSIVTTWLARYAFAPGPVPFPLLHIDTGHNFEETLSFRDRFADAMCCRLLVRSVQDTIDRGRVREETGPDASRNALQTVTLLDAIDEFRFDAAIGGARRDEEKSRAKERTFSHRDRFGQWDPRNQRPEVWALYNGLKVPGEHFRVFPLSNWTEMDVWEYIHAEQIELPSLYFAHDRDVFQRDSLWLPLQSFTQLRSGECVERRRVRFRTVGDATCTAAIDSAATSAAEVMQELSLSRNSERGGRRDDTRSDAAMEDRKRAGYF